MINIYKAENNILSKTEEINKGSRIDLINPTPFIDFFCFT